MNGDPALLLLMSARVQPTATQLAKMAGDASAAKKWISSAFSFDEPQTARLASQLSQALAYMAPTTAKENARAA